MLKKLLPYAITTVIGIAFSLIIICVKQIWAQTDIQVVMQILSDAFFVPGVVLAGVGLIIVASHGGAFDMLGYAIRNLFELLRRDYKNRKYKDFYEYRQAKKGEKRSVAFMLIVGVAFIVISAIFLIVYYNV